MEEVNLILSVPAILAIVQLIKGIGVHGKWSALVAVVLAVALNVGDYYLGAYGAWSAVTQGLLIGLAAAGLYDTAKTAAPQIGAE